MRRVTVSFDPGKASTGVVVWQDGFPVRAFYSPCDGQLNWVSIWNEVSPLVDRGDQVTIVREGQPAKAPKIQGSLLKVATVKGELTGYLVARLRGVACSVTVRELNPDEWRDVVHGKGMPRGGSEKKAVTLAWVRRTWPALVAGMPRTKVTDVSDAFGIGAAWLGVTDGH